MVARTAREILRWLESLYLTYPITVPKWDLANGFAYAEILHNYFPNEIDMITFINGRSLNSRLSNWSLIKQFLNKKNLPICLQFIDATMHGKEDGAEQLLEQTYELFTNKKPFKDELSERTNDFTDFIYQEHLKYFERAHTSKSIKNNLKISELVTDPSYAYQSKRSANIVNRSKLDRERSRIENPKRFDRKLTLAERCQRKPLEVNSNPQDWFIKSFESRSRSATSTTKTLSNKQQSRQTSANMSKYSTKDLIETNDNHMLYKEITLKQHSIPLSDLVQDNKPSDDY